MTHKAFVLFCDNEHGTGDVVFPDLPNLRGFEVGQYFSLERTAAEVRREAKKIGWGRVNGCDYCPNCMEGMLGNGGDR
jgi:hypothetical protein